MTKSKVTDWALPLLGAIAILAIVFALVKGCDKIFKKLEQEHELKLKAEEARFELNAMPISCKFSGWKLTQYGELALGVKCEDSTYYFVRQSVIYKYLAAGDLDCKRLDSVLKCNGAKPTQVLEDQEPRPG